LDRPPAALTKSRFALLMNQASVDGAGRYACDVLAKRFPGQLAAIFTPQHGLWGEQQANMIESPHRRYEPLDLPVFSLYSETRQPTAEMLRGIECLVVDLQDVGTRVYTFIWTVVQCLEACERAGIPLVILDRPNPLGGEIVEGPLLQPGYTSFVGLASIPMRHALTIGEFALWANQALNLNAEVDVVPMNGWRRSMFFSDTGRIWLPTSPNMPRWETALVYPGQVLLEGTNLSEGRGTTTPFEVVGAPFIEPYRIARELEDLPHPGVTFRPIRFIPTFDKWKGQSCGGVAWHVTDPRQVRSFVSTISILVAVRRRWPNEFAWLPPPYEYEHHKMPIDILYGSSDLRETVTRSDVDRDRVEKLGMVDTAAWSAATNGHLLYPSLRLEPGLFM
jgi:uncharacterized protein YbbC (DUF1343 family)